MPAHSFARAYEAIVIAHSSASLGMMLLRPELPEVADTQYLPANRSLLCSPFRYASTGANRTAGSVLSSSKLSISVALVSTGSSSSGAPSRPWWSRW